MKCSGKPTILAIVFVFGILGAFLRGYELAFCLDSTTNIFEYGSFNGYILPLLSLVTVSLSIFCGLFYRNEKETTYAEVFGEKPFFASLLYLISSIMLIILGIYKIINVINDISVTELVYGLLTLICGISLLFMIKFRKLNVDGDVLKFISTIQVFWSCFMLIFTFMEHPVEPVIQVFAYDLIGAITIVLVIYSTVFLVFGAKKLTRLISSSLLSIYFILITVGGRIVAVCLSDDIRLATDEPFRMFVFVAMFFYVISNTVCMLKKHDSKENKNE